MISSSCSLLRNCLSARAVFAIASLFMLFVLISPSAAAQEGLPAAIVSFYTDAYAVNFNQLEAGQARGTFTWRTIGITSAYRLALDVYVANQWLPVQEGTFLPANGVVTTALRHPLNFGMPTYRLSIQDGRGRILDQQIITIPYTLTQGVTPVVQSFTTGTASVDPRALIEKRARVDVSWQVNNRPPGSNLVFEQIFDDGSSVSVELPRTNLWVASTGSGVVAPIAPPVGLFVKLRLRVVDMTSGNAYVESELAIPIIEATPTPTATITPTATRTPTATITPRATATP